MGRKVSRAKARGLPKILVGGEVKVLDLDRFFEYLKTVEASGDEAEVFDSLAYIYRAVLLRGNSIMEIPWKILRGKRQWKNWPPALTDLFFTLECDLCIYGAAYTRIVRDGDAVQFQRLNPGAMKVEVKKKGKGIKHFEFVIGGEQTKVKIMPKDMIYIRYYDPTQDLLPGTSPTQVVLAAARLGISANKFADSFFRNYAVPATVLETPGTVDQAEQDRVESFWQRAFGGVANKFKTVLLGDDVKVKTIGVPPKEVAMPELMAEVRKQVAVAFGIPEDMLTSEAANYATAQAHAKTFWQYTVIPEARRIEAAFNDQYFYREGGYLRFDTESTIIMSEDEAKRAEAVHSLVKSGLPLGTALATLGYTIPEGYDVTPTATPLMVTGREPQEIKAALKLWQKKALRYLDERDDAFCTFYSPAIPWQLSIDVMDGLGDAGTPEEVKGVFELLL